MRRVLLRWFVPALLTLGLLGAGVSIGASPAAAGWIGKCYPWYVSSSTAGGWCDGNGPNTYRGWASCSNYHIYYGVIRWAGDRRGSFGVCPSGTHVWAYGADPY
jgi:hypothetical protein